MTPSKFKTWLKAQIGPYAFQQKFSKLARN